MHINLMLLLDIFEWFYNLFNNASVATIVGVVIASYIARKAYEKQKGYDRDHNAKTNLINDVLQVQEKLHYSLLIIDRIANTQIFMKKYNDWASELGAKKDIEKLSQIVNEGLPADWLKVLAKTNIYFTATNVKDALNNLGNELMKIHDHMVEMKFNLHVRVKDQPALSKEKFDFAVKFFIQTIWTTKTTYQTNGHDDVA